MPEPIDMNRAAGGRGVAGTKGASGTGETTVPSGRYLGQARLRLSEAAAAPGLRSGPAQRGSTNGAPRAAVRISEILRLIVRAGRLAVGVHDYSQYVEHMRLRHPGVEPMSREMFYRRCMEARYGGGGSGCPC